LLELRPGILTNDRLQRPDYPGDFGTPEQEIPDTGLDRDWETCMTMNRTWGYKSYDHDWKTPEKLIHNLIEAASKGGNYLLNIGPKADGTIPEESVERLQAIGRWMSINGESIYGTTASPVDRPQWGLITTRPGDGETTLYLHVLKWPSDGTLPISISNEVEECRLLADPGRAFKVELDESDGLTIQLTGGQPDPIASVVLLRIKGAPKPVATVSEDQPKEKRDPSSQ
jgi:alpha-L-fucosidase